MTTNYDGLTKNSWPGTWSPSSNAPIALDTELRGTLQSISGSTGDQLTDIYGQRLTEGMLVYLKTGYTSGSTVRVGDTYYKYKLLPEESRNASTGSMPNSESNWTEANFGGGGGLGYTGSAGPAGGYTGSMGEIGYTGSAGSDGATGPSGEIGYTGSAGQGAEIDLSKDFLITSDTATTALDTGSLQTKGGASVTKDLYVGGNIYTNGGLTLISKQNIVLGEEPPADPKVGDIWYDLVDGGSYQYIADDNGSFWIQFGSSI